MNFGKCLPADQGTFRFSELLQCKTTKTQGKEEKKSGGTLPKAECRLSKAIAYNAEGKKTFNLGNKVCPTRTAGVWGRAAPHVFKSMPREAERGYGFRQNDCGGILARRPF